MTTVKEVKVHLQARDGDNLDYGNVRRSRFRISCGGETKIYWRPQKEVKGLITNIRLEQLMLWCLW